MTQDIALVVLALAFSGIAWCLIKFTLWGYLDLRAKFRAWRVSRFVRRTYTDVSPVTREWLAQTARRGR